MNYTSLISATVLSIAFFKIPGKYISTKEHSYLQLKEDSTFIYESRFFHEYQHSTGRWDRISRDKILLNSFIENNTELCVDESKTANAEHAISVTTEINHKKNLSDYKCQIYLNDSLSYSVNCDSIPLLFVNKKIKSIYFIIRKDLANSSTTAISPGLVTSKYKVRYTSGSSLRAKIIIDDNNFYYRVFKTDTLLLSKKHVSLFNPMTAKWEALERVPDKTKIFSRYDDSSKLIKPID
jgi:hypothetical protein